MRAGFAARLQLPGIARDLQRLPAVRRGLTAFRSRELEPHDRLLVSFPKSGSTWLRFAIAYALGSEPDYDRIGYLVPALGRKERDGALRAPDGGRIVRSHEPATNLRTRRRTLVVVRDGRDVAVSAYYHALRAGTFDGDFDGFLPGFLSGRAFAYGTWHEHVRGWARATRERRRDAALVRYEDVLANPEEQLERILGFLGISSPRGVQEIIAATRPSRMRDQARRSEKFGSAAGDRSISLVRAATSGDWRSHFDRASTNRFETLCGPTLVELGYPVGSQE